MTARTEVVLKELNRWESQLREAPFLQGMEVGEPDRRGTAVKTMMSNRGVQNTSTTSGKRLRTIPTLSQSGFVAENR